MCTIDDFKEIIAETSLKSFSGTKPDPRDNRLTAEPDRLTFSYLKYGKVMALHLVGQTENPTRTHAAAGSPRPEANYQRDRIAAIVRQRADPLL